MKICFLVGSIGISGGSYVIIQHAYYLKKMGHDVVLAIQEPFTNKSLEWHDLAVNLNCITFAEGKNIEFDLVIATWWRTAIEIFLFKSKRYAYFVQSIESRFYDEKNIYIRAIVENTYDLPLHYITEATWIKDYLFKNHGKVAQLVKNGVRKDIFIESGESLSPRIAGKIRVLVEGPFGVSFKNTALAIAMARSAGADEIWVMTSTPVNKLPYVDKVFSQVNTNSAALIYRSCDVLVKLSTVEGMFGPPLEMFHCGGTAIVYGVTGHEEYIVKDHNAIVLDVKNLSDTVAELASVFSDANLINELKRNALNTAKQWPDWTTSSHSFCEWVESLPEVSDLNFDITVSRNKVDNVYCHRSLNVVFVSFFIDALKRVVKMLPKTILNMIKAFSAKFEVHQTMRRL